MFNRGLAGHQAARSAFLGLGHGADLVLILEVD